MVGVDGILRRRSGQTLQLVLPQKFHRTVYRELHEEMGHLGVELGSPSSEGTILLAIYERGHCKLCHTCLQLFETKETKHRAKSTNGEHTHKCTL